MEALKASTFPYYHRRRIPIRSPKSLAGASILHLSPTQGFNKPDRIIRGKTSNSKIFKVISSTEELLVPDQEIESQKMDEKFDGYSNWYPVVPVCDLDKRRPLGKRVMGIDIVIWWDRNENAWKVFDDRCPHRLAPLSEGRIDQWGRLQCVYRGWCFGGAGDCKFIPQALRDGPPADREGGRPLEINLLKLDVNGFTAKQISEGNYFIPPCLYYSDLSPGGDQSKNKTSSTGGKNVPSPPNRKARFIFYYIPVSPGHRRVIFAPSRNFAILRDRIFPRWIPHIVQNMVLDSDRYLLHVEGIVSVSARYAEASVAVLCFVASKWLAHFIYKTFRYHGYDHAFREGSFASINIENSKFVVVNASGL